MNLIPCRPGPVLVFCSRALPLNIPSAYRTSPRDIKAEKRERERERERRERHQVAFFFVPFFGILVAHHLYLKIHHLLVQRRFCSLYLLNPLEGDRQQNMDQIQNSTGPFIVKILLKNTMLINS